MEQKPQTDGSSRDHLWPLYVRTQKPVLTSHILIVLSLLLLTWSDHSEFLFTVFELLKSYHIVACGQKGNTGDIVVVPMQSFQALVAVEVPQLDRHVRAAARQHLTLFVQTDILKMNNSQSSFHQILASVLPRGRGIDQCCSDVLYR